MTRELSAPDMTRIRNLYRGAYAWRFEDSDGDTDLSGLRESLAAEFDTWLAGHDNAVREAAWDEGYSAGSKDASNWDSCTGYAPGYEEHANPYQGRAEA